MEAGTKYAEEQTEQPQLPTHLAMAVNKGTMTMEDALKFTAIVEPTTPTQGELPRHLQMAVERGRMTTEQALKCVVNN